jgi:ribosomal protein L11 methyltransferase
LAAAKLWRCPAVAVDNDEAAVRLTRENAAVNQVSRLIQAHLGEGYACPAVAASAPYDLILANILAGPLKDMAPDAIRNLAPDGIVLLSGLLTDQAGEVARAHRPLRVLGEFPIGDWIALTLGR